MGTYRKLRMSDWGKLGMAIFWSILILIGLFIALFLLMLGMTSGVAHVIFHLIGGFWPFLAANIPQISVNAATWVPGVVALVLAAVGIHFFLRPWAVKRGKRWPVGNSLALAAVIPVLFVIAFLVPGMLLQVQGLSGTRWFHREQGRGGDNAWRMMKDHWLAALIYADEHDGKFPATVDELDVTGYGGHLAGEARRGRHYWDRDLPREPVIYLGGGFTDSSDLSLPLAISPPFSEGGVPMRCVVNFGGEVKAIPSEQAEEWIARSLEARRAAEK